MEIMDPFAHELLARPPPPAFDFDFFPAAGNVDTMTMNTEFAIGQLDDYLRSIGVLPPLPPVYVPPAAGYAAAAVWGAMDYGVGVHLPATHELYEAAVDARVTQPAAPPPSPAASSYDDGSAATLGSYASEIDASLRAMEADAAYRTSPDYLDGGRVDPAARAALVAWMFDFARHFGVGPAAVHRAVSYADRFLSVSAVAATGVGTDADADHRQLRLLGAAAVYAAAKYEDGATARRVMNAGDIAACCGFAAAREVLDAERALLAALRYRLAGPTAHTFVEHFTGRAGRRGEEEEDEGLRRAAHLIADSSLLDHRCLGLLPSAVAAAAILLARLFLAPPPHGREQVRRWGRDLEELTGYKPMDVYDGLECLYERMPDDPGFEISPLLFADLS